MDADERLVWIDAEPAVDPARAGALCRRHADALRPPRGWTLDDRRDAVPRLLRVPENQQQPRELSRRSSVRTPKRRGPAAQPDLFSDAVPVDRSAEPTAPPEAQLVEESRPVAIPVHAPDSDAPGSDAPSPDETKAIPWVPRLGGGVGDDVPRGRLLDRAFGRRDDGDLERREAQG